MVSQFPREIRLNTKVPMLLDNMSNQAGLYAAPRDRRYHPDENGIVIFRTVVGSPGFDVDAWHTAIRRLVTWRRWPLPIRIYGKA